MDLEEHFGRKVLKGGVRWRIGAGSQVFAAVDPWIPRENCFKPIEVSEFAKEYRIKQFIDSSSCKWKEDLVRQAFSPDSPEEEILVLDTPLHR